MGTRAPNSGIVFVLNCHIIFTLCVCACVRVCTSVCVSVCVLIFRPRLCVCVLARVCKHVCASVCLFVCVFVSVQYVHVCFMLSNGTA